MYTQLSKIGKTYINYFDGLSLRCWRGIFLSFLESTFIGAFYFLSIYFTEILRFNVANASTIISFYGLGAILGGFIGGKLSDKISSITVSITSLFIQSICYFLLPSLISFISLSLTVFILGISTYSFITSNYLWVLNQCNQFENQRLKAINLLSTAANLGLGLSAIIISFLAPHGFKYVFLLSASILFLMACFLIFLKNKEPIKEKDEKLITSNTQPISTCSNKIFYLILICVLLIGSIVSQVSSTYPIYIQSKFPDLGLTAVSILFTLNALLVVFFETPLGHIFGNFNKILIVGVSSFLIGFGMFMLTFSSAFIMAVFASIVYTIGEILFFCMAQFVCYQTGMPSKKGHNMGLYRMVYASSRVIGPTLGGLIYYNFNGNAVWYISCIIGTLCLFLCVYYKNVKI